MTSPFPSDVEFDVFRTPTVVPLGTYETVLVLKIEMSVAPFAMMLAAEFVSKFSMYIRVPSNKGDENVNDWLSPAPTDVVVKPRAELPSALSVFHPSPKRFSMMLAKTVEPELVALIVIPPIEPTADVEVWEIQVPSTNPALEGKQIVRRNISAK